MLLISGGQLTHVVDHYKCDKCGNIKELSFQNDKSGHVFLESVTILKIN